MSEKEQRTAEQQLDGLRAVLNVLEGPGGWGRGALEVSWAIDTIQRLRAAITGLVQFRDNKAYWEMLDDATCKAALDVAFERARKALGESHD